MLIRSVSCLTALISLLLCNSAAGQFGISPTDSLVEQFTTDSVTRIFQIDFPNESPDSLGLTWRHVGGGWTEGWDVNLCDLGECYTGVPADADMLPMPPDGAGFLKLIVNAYELEGSCFLHFWVWPTGNQDALIDVYFDLRNGGISSVMSTEEGAVPTVFPNPVESGESIVISLSPSEAQKMGRPMQRFGPDGRLQPCSTTCGPAGVTVSTAGWPSGHHWIQWSDVHAPIHVVVE